MAASTQSALEELERSRAQLQQNVDKLRKALSHWTTWEAEYETLKEEIQEAGDPSPSQIREMARDLELTLLDQKEVEELLCKNSPSERTANQVIDMISRRVDYVRTSSATIEKSLDTAEKKLAGVDVLLEPGMDNEEGEPMMDIEEELDDEGNEVSSSVNQTGKAAAKLVEVLRKAGIQKAELEKKNAEEKAQDAPSATTPASHTVASLLFPEGTLAIDLEQDDVDLSNAIIPSDETPEEAELRRQMLQYGMSEIGQIVAELDLDQPTASYSDEEDDDDYGDYDTEEEEEEEEEDEYGRSTKPVITEDYRKQMMELEKKLGARMLENVGPESGQHSLEEHIGDIRTMRVKSDDQFDESLGTSSATPATDDTKEPKKKGVRFADNLDISEAPKPVQQPARATQPVAKSTPTMSDTIVERSAVPVAPVESPKPTKVSKFKSARAAANTAPQVLPTPSVPEPPPVPSGPVGRTIANTITEHAPLPSEPQAPDEFDAVLLNREIQAEYHKARNRFIQRQGGFKATEEDEESPIVEERDGKTKKVSRFMAARLKAEGM
ncbi:Prefoldin subunit-domain-containing protein [Alternaria alternata]|nr:Prefoldin subunit-domain-containing protein [Alternaria alternata]